MTSLQDRRTRLQFETSSTIRYRGRDRAVVITATPRTCVVRLKGTKQRLWLSWDGLYAFAAKCEVERVRREKTEINKSKGRK